MLQRAQPLRVRVRQPLAVRRRQDDRRRLRPAPPRIRSTAAKERLRLQHHPGPAAKRHVVHDPVPIRREDRAGRAPAHRAAPRDRPPDDPFRQRRLHHLRKDGDDVDLHIVMSLPRLDIQTRVQPFRRIDDDRRFAGRRSTSTQMPGRPAGSSTSPRSPSTTSRLRSSDPSTAVTCPIALPRRVLHLAADQVVPVIRPLRQRPQRRRRHLQLGPASASASFIVSTPSSATIGRPW